MLNNYQPKFNEIIDHLKTELSKLRTSRATPSLVEDILIDAYNGSRMRLKELASINADPRVIIIKPWDTSVIKNIEKGLMNSHLEFNPIVETDILRIQLPELTQETREKLVKKLKTILEQAWVKIRRLRDEIKREVGSKQKSGEISEDDKFRLIDDLNKMTKKQTDEIDEIGKSKEQEIMTI